LFVVHAEEAIGLLSQDVEDYPSALTHFENAFRTSHDVPFGESYMALHCATVLWRLGRDAEAEQKLAAISAEARKTNVINYNIESARARIQLSELQNRAALSTAQGALLNFPDLPSDELAGFEEVIAEAEARMGLTGPAQREADKLMALARKEADEDAIAAAELVGAEVSLAFRRSQKAGELANAANTYFASKRRKESEWLSLFYIAQAAKASGDADSSSAEAQKAIDILNELAKNWGPPTFQQYASRPDRQLAIRDLSAMCDRKGNSHHAKPQGL
jgi:cation diffusion facilitator CzcD-associated flavoprotein CzcO